MTKSRVHYLILHKKEFNERIGDSPIAPHTPALLPKWLESKIVNNNNIGKTETKSICDLYALDFDLH